MLHKYKGDNLSARESGIINREKKRNYAKNLSAMGAKATEI